jgi:hypothetical protein
MSRACWLLVALFATAAAGPTTSLPLPPVPPAHPPADRRAPVPDTYLTAQREGPSSLPDITVRDFRVTDYDHSLGYTPGSRFETSEDKRSIQTPGLSLRVPLQ